MADQKITIQLGAEASLAGVNSFIGGLNGIIKSALAAAAAITGVTAAVGFMTKQSIDAADQMGKLAQKAGQTTEDMSQFAYAAKLGDLGIEQLQSSLRMLSTWMEKTGQSARPVIDVLLEQADVFKAMPDGVEKVRKAVEVFGKSGASFIPFLNQGSEAIRGQIKEAKALGVTISTDFGQKADTFNDSLDSIRAGVQGVFNRLAEAALPGLQAVADALKATFMDPGVQDSIARLAIQGGNVVKVMADIATRLTGVIGPLLEVATRFGFLLKVLGAMAAAIALVNLAWAGFAAITRVVIYANVIPLTAELGVMSIATGALTLAWARLTAVMATPLGIGASLVVGITAGLTALETFRQLYLKTKADLELADNQRGLAANIQSFKEAMKLRLSPEAFSALEKQIAQADETARKKFKETSSVVGGMLANTWGIGGAISGAFGIQTTKLAEHQSRLAAQFDVLRQAAQQDIPERSENRDRQVDGQLLREREIATKAMQAEQQIAAAKTKVEEQEAKAAYEDKLLALDDYLAKRLELTKVAFEAEQKLLAQRRVDEEFKLAEADTEEAKARILEAMKDLDAQIQVNEIKHTGEMTAIRRDATRERIKLSQEAADEELRIQDELLEEEKKKAERLMEIYRKSFAERSRLIEEQERLIRKLQTPGATMPNGRLVGNLNQEAPDIKQRLADERAAIEKNLALANTMPAGQERDDTLQQMANELDIVSDKLITLKEQTNDFTFFEKMGRGIDELTNQFNHMGAAVADVMMNGVKASIDAVSKGIWQVIDGTATWGDLFIQVGRQIISELIKIAIQEIFLDNLKKGIATAWKGFVSLMRAKDVVEANTTEAAKTPMLATNATLASISSWGWAVVIGMAAIAGILAATGAFEKGGVVEGGEQLIRVNERGPEAVLNAGATQRVGRDWIDAINAGQMIDLPGAAAEYVSAPMNQAPPGQSSAIMRGESQPIIINLALVGSMQEAAQFLAGQEGINRVVQIARDNKTQIGIRS